MEAGMVSYFITSYCFSRLMPQKDEVVSKPFRIADLVPKIEEQAEKQDLRALGKVRTENNSGWFYYLVYMPLP
jgi:hypothetical protein